jgi:hypothetical protein
MKTALYPTTLFLAAAILPLLTPAARAGGGDCPHLTPRLAFCQEPGWEMLPAAPDSTAFIYSFDETHNGHLAIRENLAPDEAAAESWRISHAPISARGRVLETATAEIDGRIATTVVYYAPYGNPAKVVALTSVIGPDDAFEAVTYAAGEHYTEAHRALHAAFLAAIRLSDP